MPFSVYGYFFLQTIGIIIYLSFQV
jgi:hypothetical protein